MLIPSVCCTPKEEDDREAADKMPVGSLRKLLPSKNYRMASLDLGDIAWNDRVDCTFKQTTTLHYQGNCSIKIWENGPNPNLRYKFYCKGDNGEIDDCIDMHNECKEKTNGVWHGLGFIYPNRCGWWNAEKRETSGKCVGDRCALRDSSDSPSGVSTDCPGPEPDTDECDANPCQNGATCINGEAGYECKCRHGFSGTTCSTDDCNKPCTDSRNTICASDGKSYKNRCRFENAKCKKERRSGEILTIIGEGRCWDHLHLLPVPCSGCDQDTTGEGETKEDKE